MPNRKSSDTAQDTDTIKQPTHNDNPKILAPFLRKLEVWLLLRNADYRTLLEHRTVTYRSLRCVLNATHARLLISRQFPTDYGFWKPAPRTIDADASLVPDGFRPGQPAAAPPAEPAAPATVTTQAPTAAPSTPAAPPTRSGDALTPAATPAAANAPVLGDTYIGKLTPEERAPLLLDSDAT